MSCGAEPSRGEPVQSRWSRYRRPVLITSTSEVYGKSTEIPFREEASVVTGPTEKRRWAYACAKAVDEFLGLAHYHETSLPVYIVRLFNTMGPRQTGQYGMVLPTFVGQALSGKALTVFGNGKQRRCFCSVHDVVARLLRLPLVRESTGKVVNLGSPEEISIEDLARRVIALAGSSSPIEYVPYERAYGAGFDDMFRRVPDLERARRLIGWSLKYNIDAIIRELLGDCSARFGGEEPAAAPRGLAEQGGSGRCGPLNGRGNPGRIASTP
jgi:UDP-glucose 4-epimerase